MHEGRTAKDIDHLRPFSFYQKRSNELYDDSIAESDSELSKEFSQLRYTPICTEGSDLLLNPLAENHLLLRATERETPIKLFIVLTMYAEPPKGGRYENQETRAGGLIGTLQGVMNNVKEYMKREGPDAWKEISICLVSDGRTRINPDTLDFLELMGMYSEKLMKQEDSPEFAEMKARQGQTDIRTADGQEWDKYNQSFEYFTFDNKPIKVHLFESILQQKKKGMMASDKLWGPPLQLQFALKENNAGKLDSHLWFLNGFAEQLFQKELVSYTVLIDVGTVPERRSILKLMDCMDADERVGGCCGEIGVDNVSVGTMCNPVIASQHFEYKTSNTLDKALESCFGYISVLPGAFCAYRYSAIRGKPLEEYFKSITHELGPFEGNMYLAEDRILCFQLIAKEHEAWLLRYVKNAVATTDVPDELYGLVKQRRRWLNGSFFAMLYAIINFKQFFMLSAHGCFRKCLVTFQFMYYCFSTFMAWFLVANFYLSFLVLLHGMLVEDVRDDDAIGVFADKRPTYPYVVRLLTSTYSFLLGVIVIVSLGNKPENMKALLNLCALLFSVSSIDSLSIHVYTLGEFNR
jgi:chitin synthase